ncbi:phosphoenolpyruvate--protein phosphotransferase [Sphingomonas sp.]|jgi:phosphocarrier protein FPr/phosphocarrier protein|uniref:phosphoenolpyruvate--protein phosphotransferase n=1 Tax=Sphingomonas sp. TaxID=28214 RepID=UPI002ED9577E
MADPASRVILSAPLKGWATRLDDVPDAVFAERMLGDGIAIDPLGSVLHAPCDGMVLTLHAAGHALTLRTREGAEILMHIGMDTVGLAGRGFSPLVREGEQVTRGAPLIAFDIDALAARAPSLVTPIIVTNPDRFSIVERCDECAVNVGDMLMILAARDDAPAGSASAFAEHSRSVTVPLAHGIHARPAARIGGAIKHLSADVALVSGERRGDARSAVALLALGIGYGETITIEAGGVEGAEAVATVAALIESGMGEGVNAAIPAARPGTQAPGFAMPIKMLPDGALRGVTAAPGLAIGTAFRLRIAEVVVADEADDALIEQRRIDDAIATVSARLSRRMEQADSTASGIMAAHLAFLDDPALRETAMRHIAAGESAGRGWQLAIAAQVAVLTGSGNARMMERVADLHDVEGQVLRALAGVAETAVALPPGCILIADDLLPSQLVGMDTDGIAGLCTARGGPTSHVAILAAGLGLPALVAMGAAIDTIPDGTPMILHADAGHVIVDPAPDLIASTRKQITARAAAKASAHAAAAQESRTRDGIRIEAFANLGSLADAQLAVANGAEGCGLLRTEFLFLERDAAPTAAEQTADYQAIAEALAGRPLIVRLLDIGGDKPAPYLAMPVEENPALGVRGIRVGLAHPDVLETQLRAILAVRPIGQCRIMVPMVSDLGELRAVRAVLDRLRIEMAVAEPVELGIMVETPAAALIADLLAAEADFLSIGTNDLTQYALAMDRGNPAVAGGVDGLHPAVLRLIAATCTAAAVAQRWTGVCGGLASDPLAVPILIGLGVTELSSTPALVPEIKALIRRLSVPACRDHAARALAAGSAAEVRALAGDFLEQVQP